MTEEVEGRDGMEIVLLLEVDDALYALPVSRVREIVRPRSVTPVPHAPATVLGVISLRGEIIQVFDLRACLGRPAMPDLTPVRARGRIVVLQDDEGKAMALRVDRVVEVWRVAPEARRPATGSDRVIALYDRGGRFVSLLDPDRLLESKHAAA